MWPLSKSPIWRPYTQEKTAAPPVPIEKASGAYLYTTKGQEILDGISSWWLITHGHAQPEIVEAIQRQAARLDQVVFANFTHEPAEELAALLIEMTPTSLSRVFFSDNGSTAVEVALKMALQACAQRGFEKKKRFLAFDCAYHGDTVGAMSVSGDSPFNRPYKPALFEVIRARQPVSPAAALEEWTADFERVLQERAEELAGVILEPLVQAAGGMIFWPEAAVRRIAELCRGAGVFLIFDEVMTGFGRTGCTFAFERVGVVPDFVCLSKGLTGGFLPLAVTLTTEEVFEAFLSEEKSRLFFHGHSFTGNPISCAAAVANLKLFSRSNPLEKVAALGAAHRRALEKISSRIPIKSPRVCGAIGAFDLAVDQSGYLHPSAGQLTTLLLEQGLFLRPLGSTVYMMPPYCTITEAVEEAWFKVAAVLERGIENLH